MSKAVKARANLVYTYVLFVRFSFLHMDPVAFTPTSSTEEYGLPTVPSNMPLLQVIP